MSGENSNDGSDLQLPTNRRNPSNGGGGSGASGAADPQIIKELKTAAKQVIRGENPQTIRSEPHGSLRNLVVSTQNWPVHREVLERCLAPSSFVQVMRNDNGEIDHTLTLACT
jgi:hypothetical protein